MADEQDQPRLEGVQARAEVAGMGGDAVIQSVETTAKARGMGSGEGIRMDGTGQLPSIDIKRGMAADTLSPAGIASTLEMGAPTLEQSAALRPNWDSTRGPILAQARAVRAGLEELLRGVAIKRATAVGGNEAPLRDEALAGLERFARPALSTLNVAIEQLVSPAPEPLIVQQNGDALEFISWTGKLIVGGLISGASGKAGGIAFQYLCDHEPEIAHHFMHLMDQLGHLATALHGLIM